MKRFFSFLGAVILIAGILWIARADVNHGHGPGVHVEDSHGDSHGDEHEGATHGDQHEAQEHEDAHGSDGH